MFKSLFIRKNRGAAVLWIILAVIVLVGIILFAWVQGAYNKMVAADEAVKASWAQVENQLQRRYDLIPNLVETVKGFATQEKSVLIGVTEARAKVGGAGGDVNKRIGAENELSSALSRLMVIVESYPQLKSDQNFLRLQDELAGTENRLSVERRRYNEEVQKFNVLVRSFPANIIAGMFNFTVRQTFEAPADAKIAPKVKF